MHHGEGPCTTARLRTPGWGAGVAQSRSRLEGNALALTGIIQVRPFRLADRHTELSERRRAPRTARRREGRGLCGVGPGTLHLPGGGRRRAPRVLSGFPRCPSRPSALTRLVPWGGTAPRFPPAAPPLLPGPSDPGTPHHTPAHSQVLPAAGDQRPSGFSVGPRDQPPASLSGDLQAFHIPHA